MQTFSLKTLSLMKKFNVSDKIAGFKRTFIETDVFRKSLSNVDTDIYLTLIIIGSIISVMFGISLYMLRKVIANQFAAASQQFSDSTEEIASSSTSQANAAQKVHKPVVLLDQSEQTLLNSIEWLTTMLTSISDSVISTDVNGMVTFMNPAAEKLTQFKLVDAAGKEVREVFQITGEPHPVFKVLCEGTESFQMVDTILITRSGVEIPIETSAAPIQHGKGKRLGVVLVFRDVTTRKQAEDSQNRLSAIEYFSTIARDITVMKQFEDKQRLTAMVYDNITEGIIVTDRESTILSVNLAFTEVTGYSVEDVVGKNPRILKSGLHQADFYHEMWAAIHGAGRWKGEIWNRNKNQEVYLEEITITAVKDDQGEVMHYVGVFENITMRKQLESKIQYLAYHDALTGLHNRTFFNNRLDQEIDHASRNNKQLAMMFLDLDQFKRINDTFGHRIGDNLLKAVAECLKGCIRKSDTIARFGGDEFMIFLPEVFQEQDAVDVAEKILEALRQPLMLGDRELFISSSIGISVYPADGNDSETLIKNADTAMYHAKKQGRNNYRLYRSLMNDDEAVERLTLENDLHKALQNDEFLVYYQPQMNLHIGEIIGMEALVRWQHPELGMLPPIKYIPLAEDTGLIIPLGEWVLRTACTQNKAWQLAGYPPIRVAVNLSMLQFKQPDIVETILRVLQETGLDPCYLEVEITESMLMDNPDATLGTLKQLKAMGIRISLDDFGTGYSSLNYLKCLPIDTLKIGQTFIRNIMTDADDREIVNSIIHLAHSMNLRVIAEGVETTEQLNVLRAHQCDEIQGYLIGYPLPAEESEHLMRT